MTAGRRLVLAALFAAAAAGTAVPTTKGMALMGQAQCAIVAGKLAEGRNLAQQALLAGPPPRPPPLNPN